MPKDGGRNPVCPRRTRGSARSRANPRPHQPSHARRNELDASIADDLPLMRWLQEAIWPTEAKHANADFVHDGTLLAATEMVARITVKRHVLLPGRCGGISQIGMRGRDRHDGDRIPNRLRVRTPTTTCARPGGTRPLARSSLVRFAFAPHAPYTVSDASLKHIVQLAHELLLGTCTCMRRRMRSRKASQNSDKGHCAWSNFRSA